MRCVVVVSASIVESNTHKNDLVYSAATYIKPKRLRHVILVRNALPFCIFRWDNIKNKSWCHKAIMWYRNQTGEFHSHGHARYSNVIMSAKASQITGVSVVCTTVCSGADQRKHQSSASPAFVREIHRWPVDSPHKGPVARNMFPFDGVITGHVVHKERQG